MSTAYDAVAYPSRPFSQTRPLNMGVPAALFGLDFVPAERARVLEIGCGEGGNLIPMAVSEPGARFVGFDLAASAVAVGREVIEGLGLTNIRLEVLDILEADPAALGEFDYVIAHGVYSWVPAPVREAMLGLIRGCLAPHGFAFVSYNALPGCHLRQLVREMLLHHLDGHEGFEARLAAARQFLSLYIEAAPDEDPTCAAIKPICREMLARDPRVLFHDELGEVFQPFHFHEFLEAAGRHGLKFVAESEGVGWREELFPSARGKAVAAIAGGGAEEIQQYMDFLSTRLFRQTIVCRDDLAFERRVELRNMRRLWARAPARPSTPDPNFEDRSVVRFELGPESAISLDEPVLKQALRRIGEAWPGAAAIADLPDHPDVDEGLLQLFAGGRVDLTTGPSGSPAPGERPCASPLARRQAAQGQAAVVSLDHMLVEIDDADSRWFLTLLDGDRTLEELAAALPGDTAPPSVDRVKKLVSELAQLNLLSG